MSNPTPTPNRQWKTTNAKFFGEPKRREEQARAGGAAYAALLARVKQEAAK